MDGGEEIQGHRGVFGDFMGTFCGLDERTWGDLGVLVGVMAPRESS